MAQKNFIRLDKVSKTAHYESVVTPDTELINGHLVNLGTVLKSAEGEAVDFEFATEGQGFDAIVVPEYIDKGYTDYKITEDSVKAGKPARALIPEKGAWISINVELAPGVAKGDLVTTGENGLGFKKAETDDVVVGKCTDIEHYPFVGNLAVIRFA